MDISFLDVVAVIFIVIVARVVVVLLGQDGNDRKD